MKHKTLFRLMLKAVGVWIFASGAHQLFPMIAATLLQYSQTGSFSFGRSDYYYILNLLGSALYAAFGVYLFFGGRWLVDKAIPSNRPYCHECGYDLTGAKRNRCPECDTPFRPEDVMPREEVDETESTISSQDQNFTE